jgi:hypothetical protein
MFIKYFIPMQTVNLNFDVMLLYIFAMGFVWNFVANYSKWHDLIRQIFNYNIKIVQILVWFASEFTLNLMNFYILRNLHREHMQSYIFQIKPPPVHVYHFVSPSPNILSNSSTVIFLKVLHENMVSLSENQKFFQFNQVNITIISILMNSGYTQHNWLQILVSDWLISKNLFLWNCLAKWTEIWYEAPMEGSGSFLKTEWKVSDTVSTHWGSSDGNNSRCLWQLKINSYIIIYNWFIIQLSLMYSYTTVQSYFKTMSCIGLFLHNRFFKTDKW